MANRSNPVSKKPIVTAPTVTVPEVEYRQPETIIVGPKTAAQVMSEANHALLKAEGRRKALTKVYKEEDKIPMYLSPMYRPHFGNVMAVSINGLSIYFPVNGQTYMIPETYADEIVRRRMAVDNILVKQTKMANIPANNENAPGELKLF